jgi:outer membrane receptor protein involved in Fe transport
MRMNPKFTKALVALALALLVVPAAFAQTTGRIDGTVTDDQDAPLPGVTVTVSSPSLQGDRLQVTGADGQFRFLALPPGSYSLKAALEGFTPLEQTGISVGLDRTVTLSVEMSPGFGEEVTVSGAAPIIDTSSTTSGASFGEELFQELPTTRTFQGLAFAAPGVVSGGLGDLNPSIGGASAAENRYVVDGLDTTDGAFGTSGAEVPFEFIKEVEVKTGGYEAEYGGALGGVLNVITKSGGNDLQGDVFGYYTDDSLQSEVPPTEQFGQDLGFEEYDFGAAIGGKLIQDKLWYFIAANPSFVDTEYTTASGLNNTEGEDQTFFAGKLTWQVNPSHQIVGSAFGDTFERENDLARASLGRVGNDDSIDTTNYGVTYNGTLSSSLFAEVSVGRYDQTAEDIPLDPGNLFYEVRNPAWIDSGAIASLGCAGDIGEFEDPFEVFVANPGCLGGTFHQESGDNSRDEIRGALTWFGETGALDHEIKIGGTVRDVEYLDNAHYPGPVPGAARDSFGTVYDAEGLRGQRWQLFGSAGGGFLQARLVEYDQNSLGQTDEQAVFFQDRVRIGDYFSLNLGVRADSFESTGEASDDFDNRSIDFGFSDMVAPRLGFTWDVLRNGRSKLYGHFGQFYESVPLDINARAFGNEQFNLYFFAFPNDGTLPSAANPGEHFYTYSFGTGTRVSDDLEPMYTEEILAGFEYEVLPNVAVGIKYTERSINNVIEDISVDGGSTYFITNPGGIVTVNPVTEQPLDEPVFFPEPTRDYEAIELSLNKRFTNNWQLYASYVNSENIGNYGGLFRQDNGQLDPNITSLYDLPDLLDGAFGLLPNDREHQFKAYGSYLWPFKLVTGFYGQFLSGNPISKLGAHDLYGRRERFVEPRGTFGRTSDIWNLDLHVEYPIQFGNGQELKLIADIFNITDEQEPTTVDQEWTFASDDDPDTPINEATCGGPDAVVECGDANRQFGTATNYQDPRTLRLGVKFSF